MRFPVLFSVPMTLGLLGLVTLAACESTVRRGPTRDGPPFAEAFAGPQALLETVDVADTRERLARVRLPDTQEHHDALVEALRAADAIDAEHLLLLTEAVHGYNFSYRSQITIVTNGESELSIELGDDYAVTYARGTGPFASVLDVLLIEGIARLDHATTTSEAGRLLTRTQGDEALHAVAERVLGDVDDGSSGALARLLDEVDGDEVKRDLALNELLPTGRLEGERAHVVVNAMAFDDGRREVVTGVAEARDTIPFDDAGRWMDAMAFDQGRADVLEVCAPKLTTVDGDALAQAVSMMAFDDGRLGVVRLLAPRLSEATFDDVMNTTGAFAFDGGRTAAMAALCEEESVAVYARDLPRALELAAFDNGRIEILRTVSPRLRDGVDARTAAALLDGMAFDAGRLDLVDTLKDHLEQLPQGERAALCDLMNFDAGKKKARVVLGLSEG